jgi:hypothetical protein
MTCEEHTLFFNYVLDMFLILELSEDEQEDVRFKQVDDHTASM